MSKNLPDKNPMIDHYLKELHVLSSEIIRNFEEVEQIIGMHKPGDPGVISFPHIPDKYFFIRPEVFTRISTIQVHSANIKKFLFPTPRKKNEAAYKFEYREKRTAELQAYFDLDKISEIKNAKVRNSLEHYDDRLDNISLRLWNGTIDKQFQVITSNTILSSEGAIVGRPYYLNSYIIDSKIYKNAEEESNIGKLVQEARYILRTIEDDLDIDGQTGSFIPIPQNLQ